MASIVGALALIAIVAKFVKKRGGRKNGDEENTAVNGIFPRLNDDGEDMKEVKDDDSLSIETEEYTLEEDVLVPCATFESDDQSDSPGFEVEL